MAPAKTLSNRGEGSELALLSSRIDDYLKCHRVSELALPSSQIDDYLKCHRSFIQQLMEAEAEIHSRALG